MDKIKKTEVPYLVMMEIRVLSREDSFNLLQQSAIRNTNSSSSAFQAIVLTVVMSINQIRRVTKTQQEEIQKKTSDSDFSKSTFPQSSSLTVQLLKAIKANRS